MSTTHGTTEITATRAHEAEDTGIAVLDFAGGLPGFADLRKFALVRWGGEDSPLSLLKSLERPEIEFVVAPPNVFFPDYQPELDDETAERLGLRSADDALLLVILTVRRPPETATANLMGPIIVNKHTLDAAQVVLADSGYELRAPLGG